MELVRGKAVCHASAAQFLADKATHRDAYDRMTASPKFSRDIAHIYISYFKNGLCNAVWVDDSNRRIVSFTGDPEEIHGVFKDHRAVETDWTEVPLEYYRVIEGMTREELSKESGVSVQSITRFENCERIINQAAADTVLKLAKALDVSVEDLMM